MSATILDKDIEIYQSQSNAHKYVAMIAGFDWVFRGSTPMQAHKRADDWRRARWNEIAKPAERVKSPKAKAKAPAATAAPTDSNPKEEIKP